MSQDKDNINKTPLMSDTVFRQAENKDISLTSNREFWKSLVIVILVLLFIIIVFTYFFPLSDVPSTYP